MGREGRGGEGRGGEGRGGRDGFAPLREPSGSATVPGLVLLTSLEIKLIYENKLHKLEINL